MEEVIIRTATISDLEELYRFEQGVIAAERPFDPTLKTDPIYYYNLPDMINAAHIEIVVAAIDNKIVGSGYARIEVAKPFLNYARYCYLGFMYVLPEYRGKGINKKIIGVLKNWAIGQNIRELRLDVYVDNISAIKAYEKFGFSKLLVEMRLPLD